MADSDIPKLARALDALRIAGSEAVRGAVSKQGLALTSDVKKRASRSRTLPSVSGKPPRLQTGDYNRSIGVNFTSTGNNFTASVGTNKPQGYRLEIGFDGPGQHTYPHPHFGPALDAAAPKLVDAVVKAVAEAAAATRG